MALVGNQSSLDFNLAQVIYAENVLPVSEGIRSVAYEQHTPATPRINFNKVFSLRDANENHVLYSPARNNNEVHNVATKTWTSIGTVQSRWAGHTLAAGLDPANSVVTYAYVDGRTIVCYSRLQSSATPAVDMSIMYWEPGSQTLNPATALVTNVPFAPGTIDGIASSSGFLILWSGISIAWAPFDGTSFNFAPLVNNAFSGAGREIPEDIKGNITSIIGVAGGFIVFTNRNAISAHFTTNTIAAPWIFREIHHYLKTGQLLEAPKVDEIQAIMNDHLRDHHHFYGDHIGVRSARKHIGWYCKGLRGSHAFKQKMNTIDNCQEQLEAVNLFFESLKNESEYLIYEEAA